MEIVTAELAFEVLRSCVSSDVEEFWALALGPRKEVLSSRMLFRGTVDSCLVHPRDVFRFALSANASALLVAHNHPSGEMIPSMEDLRFTRQLVRAAALMEIPVVDHIIVTARGFASLRSEGWCAFDDSAVSDVWRTYAGGVRPGGVVPGGAAPRGSGVTSDVRGAGGAGRGDTARGACERAAGPTASADVRRGQLQSPAKQPAFAPVQLANAERVLFEIASGGSRVHSSNAGLASGAL